MQGKNTTAPGSAQRALFVTMFHHRAATLLLTHALGNSDCHTKNLAFLYSGLEDVQVAPIYDMLTIVAYDSYADYPPGMSIDGRKPAQPS